MILDIKENLQNVKCSIKMPRIVAKRETPTIKSIQFKDKIGAKSLNLFQVTQLG